jgi:hypothetical protein
LSRYTCCLNFDKTISELFGTALSLQGELAFSLQFAKMTVEQLSGLQQYGIPEHIRALDARLQEGLTDEDLGGFRIPVQSYLYARQRIEEPGAHPIRSS